jgi:hypothetical protein
MIWQIERIVRKILIKQKSIHIFQGFETKNSHFFIKNNNNLRGINKKALMAYLWSLSFTPEIFDVKIFPPRCSY